jgi:hypothetical protein
MGRCCYRKGCEATELCRHGQLRGRAGPGANSRGQASRRRPVRRAASQCESRSSHRPRRSTQIRPGPARPVRVQCASGQRYGSVRQSVAQTLVPRFCNGPEFLTPERSVVGFLGSEKRRRNLLPGSQNAIFALAGVLALAQSPRLALVSADVIVQDRLCCMQNSPRLPSCRTGRSATETCCTKLQSCARDSRTERG